MNCRKKKKKSKPIRWREEPKIVFNRNQSVHLERENSSVPGAQSCSCSTTKHKPLPINHSRRLTLATNAMISHTTPFCIVDFNMVSTVIIILTFVVAVYGHECKDLKLSASDHSVIDMMKHYLHTSRKTECSNNKLSNTFKVD